MFNLVRFGAHLSRLRRNADMTQSDLAERINVTRQAISKYETGDSFPDISVLLLLSEVLGVTVSELIAAGDPTAGEARILKRLAAGGDPIAGESVADVTRLAPLLRPSTVAALAERLQADGLDISEMVRLSEYLSDAGNERLFALRDCRDLTEETLTYLLPFLTYDSRLVILDKILEGELDWHLLRPLRVDRSLVEAAVIYGVLPERVLWEL